PTALVSGERNYLSIPLVFGLGVPLSPTKAITITPWGELSPGVNLDTTIRPFRFEDQDPSSFVDPTTGEITLDESDIERVLADSVELEMSAGVGARAGLDFALHLSDAVDIGLNATLSSVGTAFAGARVIYVGGGLIFRWDDIGQRFRRCPNRRLWKSPEEISAEPPVSSNPPPGPLTLPAAPASAAPVPPPANGPLPPATEPLPPSTGDMLAPPAERAPAPA